MDNTNYMKACIGCLSYDPNLKICKGNIYGNGTENLDECPCRKCIVKTMCNKICDSYKDYQLQRIWSSGSKK